MESFGRYALIRRVARGGMAEIWKARIDGPAGFEKTLALKMVLPELADEREFVAMLIEEAKLVAGLIHPNIVQVFDFGAIEGRYFVAMEYVAGANVSALLSRLAGSAEKLPRECALAIALAAARGLSYAHARVDAEGVPLRIVHRDVSPQNVLVSFDGEVKIGDFGIARAANAIARTETGHVRGKLAFMSPEQARLEPLDGRSDLFALGLVLYEMLTGKRYFAGPAGEVYPRLKDFSGLSPEELAVFSPAEGMVLQDALAGDPARRFRDASAMEDAIATALNTVSGEKAARALLSGIVRAKFGTELAREQEEATGSKETQIPAPRVPAPGDAPTRMTPATGSALPVGATSSGLVRPEIVQTQAPRLSRRTLSRRTLVTGLGATAMAGSGLAWLAVRGRGGMIRRGGVLRIASTAEDEPYDPYTTADTRSRQVMGLVCESLIASEPNRDVPRGVIAHSELSPGGFHLTLTIRPGVWFHDHPCFPGGQGRPLDAADLAFSITLAHKRQSISLPIRGVKDFGAAVGERLAGLLVVSPQALAIDFDSPAGFSEVELANVVVLPRELETTEPDLRRLRQPVGTGPFRFLEAPRLDRVILRRAPRYWALGADGRSLPYLDGVEIETAGNYQSMFTRLGRGEIDVAYPAKSDYSHYLVLSGPRPRLADEFKDLGQLGVMAANPNAAFLYGMFVMGRKGALEDPRVVRAAALAFDRAALAEHAGPLTEPAGRFMRSSYLGFDPTIPDLGYDPEQSRALLAQAGHPNGEGLPELVLAHFPHPPSDEDVAKALRAVGFRVRLMPITGTSFQKVREDKAADGVLSQYSTEMSGMEIPGMGLMFKGWGNGDGKDVEALAAQLAAAPARADRVPIYPKIERAFLTDLPMIPILWARRDEPSTCVAAPNVRGLIDPVTLSFGSFGSLPRVWLA